MSGQWCGPNMLFFHCGDVGDHYPPFKRCLGIRPVPSQGDGVADQGAVHGQDLHGPWRSCCRGTPLSSFFVPSGSALALLTTLRLSGSLVLPCFHDSDPSSMCNVASGLFAAYNLSCWNTSLLDSMCKLQRLADPALKISHAGIPVAWLCAK